MMRLLLILAGVFVAARVLPEATQAASGDTTDTPHAGDLIGTSPITTMPVIFNGGGGGGGAGGAGGNLPGIEIA